MKDPLASYLIAVEQAKNFVELVKAADKMPDFEELLGRLADGRALQLAVQYNCLMKKGLPKGQLAIPFTLEISEICQDKLFKSKVN